MQTTRDGAGVAIRPAADRCVQPRRLHGGDSGPTEHLLPWSDLDPGARMVGSHVAAETVYLVPAGHAKIGTGGDVATVNRHDSADLSDGTVGALFEGDQAATRLTARGR